MMRSTSSPAPIGTVDLTTTTVKSSMTPAISRAASCTKRMSAEPISASDGVPTAMKIAFAPRPAALRLVVNVSRPAAWLARTSSLKPGS